MGSGILLQNFMGSKEPMEPLLTQPLFKGIFSLLEPINLISYLGSCVMHSPVKMDDAMFPKPTKPVFELANMLRSLQSKPLGHLCPPEFGFGLQYESGIVKSFNVTSSTLTFFLTQ